MIAFPIALVSYRKKKGSSMKTERLIIMLVYLNKFWDELYEGADTREKKMNNIAPTIIKM